MKKNNIKVIFSSHLSDEENLKFERHVTETIGVDHSIHCYPNHNEFSLCQVYNRALSEHRDKNSILVFVHNDILFDTKDWGKVLLKHFNNPNNEYQIIGVAGAIELNPHGCWWLNADRSAMNTSKMVGIVNHFNGIRKWTSQYSTPHFGVKPVINIDGLFMAVDADPEDGITSGFDETYVGFHFYDVSLCLSNFLDGCNIGVITDIRITHKSIGETNEQWEANRKLFSEIYRDYLPISVDEYL